MNNSPNENTETSFGNFDLIRDSENKYINELNNLFICDLNTLKKNLEQLEILINEIRKLEYSEKEIYKVESVEKVIKKAIEFYTKLAK